MNNEYINRYNFTCRIRYTYGNMVGDKRDGGRIMTMPNERRWAVDNTRQFLVDLMDPKKTPRVPSSVRKEAYRCLKHYPGEYYMEQVADQAPEIFGDWDAGIKDE